MYQVVLEFDREKPHIVSWWWGHCASVIDVIESQGAYQIIGIVDKEEFKGQQLLGYNYIGEDKDLPDLISKFKNVVITLGMIKSNTLRVKLFNLTKSLGANFPVIKSPSAHVSRYSKISPGTVVMHHAIVNSHSKIGENCIINTKALIEHDCIIGNHCHMSTAATVNGSCTIGDNVMIGSNSVLLNGVKVISNTIIGAGGVVVKNVDVAGTLVGNPAKTL
ncbi:acetyltransferase [Nonlabens spongiae]|uniref:Acetyltransferase n=2 Tax=Nonlabens spongiae TaxID=331648 RepID=A0A1W6MP99_9FLAO|nr:acetyltransferase [Nonlabens spongiae]